MLNQTVALAAVALAGVLLLVVGLLAARHSVLFKMGLRNLGRRRGQTALIVVGLMLSTVLITTSLALGESVSYSLQLSGIASVGNLDEGLSQQDPAGRTDLSFFSAQQAESISASIRSIPQVAAVSGAILTPQQSVAAFDMDTQQVSAENTILAVPPDFGALWGAIHDANGSPLSFADLSGNAVILNKTLGTDLNAHAGDTVRLFIHQQPMLFTVRAVLSQDIDPLSGSQMIVMPLATYQQVVRQPGAVNVFFIKNVGAGGLADLGPNNSVSNAVAHALRAQFPSYTVSTFKADAVNTALAAGAATTVAISAFSALLILAGLLLIHLIFLMLAGERRAELGMGRAIGMQRSQVVAAFLFEGVAYALASALGGLPIGVGVTVLLVQFINATPSPLAGLTYSLQPSISWAVLVVSFSLGLALTCAGVAFSAYRASRMTIVAAIRNLDEGHAGDASLASQIRAIGWTFRNGWRRLRRGQVLGFLASVTLAPLRAAGRLVGFLFEQGPATLAVGALLIVMGVRSRMQFPYALGVSLLIVGAGLSVRTLVALWSGKADRAGRIGATLLGAGLLIYWLPPFGTVEQLLGFSDRMNLANYQGGVQVLFLQILATIGGAIALVITNGDLLVMGVTAVTVRLGRVAPVARTSMAYPLQYKTRTGLTVAMFAMVTFLIVVIVTLNSVLAQNIQPSVGNGGWQIQTDSPGLPPDLVSQVQADPKLSSEVATTGWQDVQLTYVQQVVAGKQTPVQGMLMRAADDVFYANTLMHFQARAAGYTSDRQVEDALQQQPGLAVLAARPGYTYYNIAPGFQPFTATIWEIAHPNVRHQVQVIGILPQVWQWPGLFISLQTGTQVFSNSHLQPKWYVFKVRPGISVNQVGFDLGAAFGARYGMQPQVVNGLSSEEVAFFSNMTIFLTGYLALGLIIGVAGLGILASRAVIDRRQQIGMLRALGYSRGLVQVSFLLESGFIAFLGLIIGCGLGAWAAIQVADTLFSRDLFGMGFQPPLAALALILAGSYLATLATTYLPARAAAHVKPADALRYE